MDSYESYELLAEHIFFFGISAKALEGIVKYKPSKTFKDVQAAIDQGILEGLGVAEREFSCMARRLSDVVEIDPNEPLQEVEQRLKAIQPARA